MSKSKRMKFSVGDKIWSKVHGYGIVTDVNPDDQLFRYNASFYDGTSIWYDGRNTTIA